jgi:hypothetical protein
MWIAHISAFKDLIDCWCEGNCIHKAKMREVIALFKVSANAIEVQRNE